MKKKAIQDCLADLYYTAPVAEQVAVEGTYQNLTVNEMHILSAIDIRGEKGTTVIAKSLHLGRHMVAGSIRRLENKGYVIREKQEGDAVTKIMLTEQGTGALAVYKNMIRKGVADMVADMSDEEVDIIIKGMKRMKGCFDQVIEEYSETE